jgi:predicted transcriptional regulator
MSPKTAEIGPLEMEALGTFDSDRSDETLSVADVQGKLKTLGKTLAYTTVMTVLTRLYKKGFLTRSKEGRQFVYRRAQAMNQVSEGVLTRIGRTLFRNDALKPILALIDREKSLSRDELMELKRVVDRKLKETQPR